MRILIYGAGVIGCLYGALLSRADIDVSIYARGERLKMLQRNGLQVRENNAVKTADVTVIPSVENNERYDFILLTVKENQLYTALSELRDNISPTIVTMVNSLDTYDKWEEICGRGRILPAFPGAGGGFNGEVLEAGLTPGIVQPTTIGRADGREIILQSLFKRAGIPCQIVDDMHIWQICHLAMVVPVADAYYASDDPKYAGKDRVLMRKTASRIKSNFHILAERGIKLSPGKMNVFRILPVPMIASVLGFVFRSRFGDRFMYRHSMKAPDEMRQLHDRFYDHINVEEL